MKPVPRDDNGNPLLDRGTELFTYRIAGQGTDLLGVTLPVDFKEVMFHVESGTEVLYVSGTVAGSTTARLTAAGYSWKLPVTAEAGATFANIAAPEGTVNVSIFAWR